MKSWTWANSVRSQSRRPAVYWSASGEVWPAGRGRGFCPSTPLWWDHSWGPVSSSRALSARRTWSCWRRSVGGPQKWSEGWNYSCGRKGWESWDCPAWRRDSGRYTLLRPCSSWRGLIRKMETDFLQECAARGQWVIDLYQLVQTGYKEKVIHIESGETLEQVLQRDDKCPMTGSI